MDTKKLLGVFVALFIVFVVLWSFSPTTGQKVPETTTQQKVEVSAGDYIVTQRADVPENYVAVAGFKNVYKVVENGEIKGYKEKTKSGFVDYDINIPSYFVKIDGSDEIYQVTNDDGSVQYRKFNGKEWDIVTKEGKIIFEIPDNYTRVDLSKELYLCTEEGETTYKQLFQFSDGSYGWKNTNT